MRTAQQESRRLFGGHAANREREKRRWVRLASHEVVAHRAPTSTIFFTKPLEPERCPLNSSAFPAEAAGAAADGAAAEAGRGGNAALEAEAAECFCLFDTDGDGLVAVTDVATMLRSLGFVLPTDEVKAYEAKMRRLRVESVDFQTFYGMVSKGFPRQADPVEVLKAFHLLDREKKGSVNIKELHHLLTTLGDPIEEEGWQRLLKRTLAVRESGSAVAIKSGTFLKLICAPAEGEEWSNVAEAYRTSGLKSGKSRA
ncbi:hypothetical protein Efla_006227 [Eimeria flavescens]